jgi:hypothetical protein
MHRAWLHIFSSFHQAAATIWSLERLPFRRLYAVFFCVRNIPAWRLYTRAWDATSGELAHIARVLDAHGVSGPIHLYEFRRESMQLMLAGTPTQIGQRLRILVATSPTLVQQSEKPRHHPRVHKQSNPTV